MMKRISIIVATYNAERTLARCLESIAREKTDQVELVIVDGGSTDATLSIIKEHQTFVDNYISEKDKGIYDAWNKGIKISTGQWIQFIGADDVLLPGALTTMFKAADENPQADIISGKAHLVDADGTLMENMGEAYQWCVFRWRFNISHGSTWHQRKLFDEIGLFDIQFKICGDYELLLRKPLSSAFVNQYIIQMQAGGMSTTLKARSEAYLARKKNHALPTLVNWLFGKREKWGYRLSHINK